MCQVCPCRPFRLDSSPYPLIPGTLCFLVHLDVLNLSCTVAAPGLEPATSPRILVTFVGNGIQKPKSGEQMCSIVLKCFFSQALSVDRARIHTHKVRVVASTLGSCRIILHLPKHLSHFLYFIPIRVFKVYWTVFMRTKTIAELIFFWSPVSSTCASPYRCV